MSEHNMEIINMKIYKKLISAVSEYFAGKDVQYIFLHGGCFWLASMLHQYIPDSDIVFNRKMQHCACFFNHGVYDIRGRIFSEGFAIASRKDMEYMRKHFVPPFDVEAVSSYLREIMEK